MWNKQNGYDMITFLSQELPDIRSDLFAVALSSLYPVSSDSSPAQGLRSENGGNEVRSERKCSYERGHW